MLRKVDNKDIEKLKDVDKLVPVPVDLTKLMMLLKKFYIMLKWKILNIKYLILETLLLILLLMMKWMTLRQNMKFTKTQKTSEIENITTNHDHDKYITTQ